MTQAGTPELVDVLPPPGGLALVIGLGRSGVALTRFLLAHEVRVRICDMKDERALSQELAQVRGAEVRLGGYGPDVIEGCDSVFASPGVPWHSELLELARSRGKPVSSEIDLFFRACPAEITGITGTNGKTTTTAMVGAVLRRGDRPVVVAGNIGETALDLLPGITPEHLVVLELSSFQLESIARPRVHVAVVLNITPDHLDWHGSVAAYVAAKARIVDFQGPSDFALLNGEDDVCRQLASRTRAQVVWFDQHRPAPPSVPMPGRHNLLNAMAAAAVGRLAGIPDKEIESAIASFPGVEHRLELVGEWGGVRWYNDSKATNPDAGRMALQALAGRPLILIAGGYGGGFDLEPWLREVIEHTDGLILMGASAEELSRLLTGRHQRVERAHSIEEAVAIADRLAPPRSAVLLSPAYKSYDMFRDFEDRGRRFKAAVRALKDG